MHACLFIRLYLQLPTYYNTTASDGSACWCWDSPHIVCTPF